MKKPHIFITIHYLELGGAEASLIGLLQALDYSKVDVDLFVHAHHGELMPMIPKEVNLLHQIEKYSMLEAPITTCVKRGFFDVAICRLMSKVNKWFYFKTHPNVEEDDDYYRAQYTTWLLPKINPEVEYDLAISFLTPHKIVLDKVKARKKVAWIHTDYVTLKVAADLGLPVWRKYDYIASISTDITRTFLEVFPSLSEKIVEIENIISSSLIRERADFLDVSSEMPKGYITLLSVGRYCHAKNYDNVPEIAKRVVESGCHDLRWYIIGFGGDESLIRQKIAEAGMENHVIMLGKKNNPYPYIKACDIYVQPSRYEGKSITVREAQILCKPVVITNYATANSQVINGVDGVIVPKDNEACAQGILSVINNKVLQERLISHLSTHDYGNKSEVEKIYSLI